MTLSPSASAMPRTPIESRPLNTRTSSTGKRMHWPARRGQQHVVLVGADLDVDDPLALVEPHGDLAGAVDLREVAELVAPDRAARRGEHHVERLPGRLVLGQRHDGGDALALLRAAAG